MQSIQTRPSLALPSIVTRSKTLSAASMLTDEDVEMILHILPQRIEEVCHTLIGINRKWLLALMVSHYHPSIHPYT